ncbi:MAG: twin-arginine translocase TatA/TatE family subunit [Janthinobacterium lividum]
MLLASLFLFIEQPKTLIFIAIILVLFFGAKRIPEMMRGLGQGVREFKDATKPTPEQPMNPGGYASQNPNYPPQATAYDQPGYSQQAAPYGQPGYPQQPQQYPAQPASGYHPTAPASQVPPATSYPDAGNQPLG